jgi:hypothetical protein
MSDTTGGFANLVPGFDFLQNLVKSAGAAMPGVGQWIAPTLDPEVLEKRIGELRTVQFWLEQNARLLGTTIQALEVQRMTLATLKTMNVSLGDLTESLKIKLPEAAAAPAPAAQAPAAAAAPAPAPAPVPASAPAGAAAPSAVPGAAAAPAGVIDPMQWWGALTQQFSELAANAMKDGNTDAARHLAGAMVKQGIEAAGATLQQASALPVAGAQNAQATRAPAKTAKPTKPAASRKAG